MPENQAAALVVEDPIESALEPKVEKNELDALKEQIENSKKELERERLRAEAAERQREEYQQKLSAEANQRVKAQEDSVESRIAARQAEAERLKRDMKEAYESGRADDYADLVAEYSSVRAEVKGYENYKSQLVAQEEARARTVQNDPLVNYTPRTQQWIKNNPEFLSDNKFQKKALAAHHLAVSEDYTPDTDAYFEYIENYIKPKAKEEVEDTPPKKVSTALPPSRSGSSASSKGQSKQIRLTPEEVEHAIWAFPTMSPADAQNEYYKNKMELINSGKMGRS